MNPVNIPLPHQGFMVKRSFCATGRNADQLRLYVANAVAR
jgi:hypothetical protein